MKTTYKFLAVSLLALVGITAGCSKQITMTIFNHSDSTKDIKITVPDGTFNVGSVGSGGGSTMYTVKIKNEHLPANCHVSAGLGVGRNFTVTEFTPSQLWFHVSKDGSLVGPLNKNSGHTENLDPDVLELRSNPRMIVE